MRASNNIFVKDTSQIFDELDKSGYKPNYNSSIISNKKIKEVIFRLNNRDSTVKVEYNFVHSQSINRYQPSLKKTYSPLQRLIFGIKALAATIFSACFALFSKNVRDDWKKCLGGESIIHVFVQQGPTSSHAFRQVQTILENAHQIDIK